jgi:hypothetical protein
MKWQITNTLELTSTKSKLGRLQKEKNFGRVGKRSMLSKIGAERQSYGIGRLCKTLFGLLVISMVLYGCELWANSSTPVSKWKQIEKIQKRLIT